MASRSRRLYYQDAIPLQNQQGYQTGERQQKSEPVYPRRKAPYPFPRMICFGDGETDVPCMKMVKEHGGHSIAVYDNEDKQKTACQLVKEGRVNFMCSANYSKGSVMNIIVKRILDKIKADFEFDRLIELNQKKAWK